MVKLLSLNILYKCPSTVVPLASTHDLQSFNYFQRSSIQEFMQFTSKIITERTQPGQRQSVKENNYLCHVFIREDRLAGVLISDEDYPRRVAFTVLSKLYFVDTVKVVNDAAERMVKLNTDYSEYITYNTPQCTRPEHLTLDDFAAKIPKADWPYGTQANIQYNGLPEILLKYQNPREADAMSRVQADLDETKCVLHNTMESLLQRGEKLDDLVDKSNELSLQSRTFYKQAKKANSWCCCIQ